MAPTTTAAPTTTIPATTTTIPEIVPEPGDTLWDVIQRDRQLNGFQDLVERAGLVSLFDGSADPAETYTVFAPTNDAVDAFNESVQSVDQSVLKSVVNSAIHAGGAIEMDELLGMSEITVIDSHPQQIDGTATPPTIGGAAILEQVPPESNGVLYLIDQVLQPVLD